MLTTLQKIKDIQRISVGMSLWKFNEKVIENHSKFSSLIIPSSRIVRNYLPLCRYCRSEQHEAEFKPDWNTINWRPAGIPRLRLQAQPSDKIIPKQARPRLTRISGGRESSDSIIVQAWLGKSWLSQLMTTVLVRWSLRPMLVGLVQVPEGQSQWTGVTGLSLPSESGLMHMPRVRRVESIFPGHWQTPLSLRRLASSSPAATATMTVVWLAQLSPAWSRAHWIDAQKFWNFGNSEIRSQILTTFVPKIVPKFAISFFLLRR